MKKIKLLLIFFVICFSLVGCSSNNSQTEENTDEKVIFKSTISPNEEYVESKDEVVTQTIKVSQNEEGEIFVEASSNSAFFEKMSYSVEYYKEIDEKDVEVKWFTLMGSDKPSKENQLCVADIIIKDGAEVVSERKVNFAKKAIETIVEDVTTEQ